MRETSGLTARTMILAAAVAAAAFTAIMLSPSSPALAAEAAGARDSWKPPGADFRLPDWIEIILVIVIAAAAVVLGLMCLPLTKLPGPPGWAAQAVMVVLLLPVFEEVVFRFFGIEVLAVGILNLTKTQAFLWTTILFAIAHLVLAVAVTTVSKLAPRPPGIQVCEGCLIGVFNGMVYIMLRFVGPGDAVGLLVTMFYCWMAHILANLGLVIFNLVVNLLMPVKGILLHVFLRLGLLAIGVAYLIWTYIETVEAVIWEVWIAGP